MHQNTGDNQRLEQAASTRRRISVATYNIHGCMGLDHRRSPFRTAEVIKELNADIVGLQEVDSSHYNRRSTVELDDLARAIGYEVISGPTLLKERASYGNALLSRYPVIETRRFDLSVSGREPRGGIDVTLRVDELDVRVINTHFGLNRSERLWQAQRLLDLCRASSGAIEILLGDTNEWIPLARSLSILHDRFGESPRRRTYPSFFPIFALDRIWVWPEDSLIQIGTHKTSLSRVASDHLPVKARISLKQSRVPKIR